jgi:hypothetical protein
MANIGLYYPYIQFRNYNWLKLTALYWDQMARIVPSGFPLADPDGVRLLADKTGFVFERPPHEDEMVAVAAEFEKLIAQYGHELEKRYSLKHRASWPLDPITVATEPNADPHLGYIYPTKMQASLATTLVKERLAEYGPSRPDVGLGLHPQLADVYMLMLARAAAKNTGYQPVTDETQNHVGMAACTREALVEALLGEVEVASPIDRGLEAEMLLLNMAFTAVLPANVEHVPMKKIIEVRNTWAAERWQFQEGVKAILSRLRENMNVPDPDAYRRHVAEEFEKKLKRPLDELRTQLKRAKLDSITGAFSLTTVLPTGTLAATALHGAPLLVGAAVALVLGTYKLLSGHRAKQEALMRSPAAYLVRLEEELSPDNLERSIRENVRSFELGPLP